MNHELEASHAFCAEVSRREARNFYPSFRFLPVDRRRAMCALYAFLRHSDDIADEPSDSCKRTALESWRTELDLALEGHPAPGRWPGWAAFAETVQVCRDPRTPFARGARWRRAGSRP